MIDRLLSLVAPHICCSCGENTSILCECCFHDIIEVGYEQCIVCLHPTVRSNLCDACRASSRVDDAWAVGERKGALKELVDLYKFDRAYESITVLARLLSARVPQVPPDTIVGYVPDITTHRRQRGYDHMQKVAQEFARQRGLTCVDILHRRTSLSQRGFSRRDRLVRQHGAFDVDTAIDAPVLLLDDVYTTGATLNAGVAALRMVSSYPVYVGVIARQPLDDHRDL